MKFGLTPLDRDAIDAAYYYIRTTQYIELRDFRPLAELPRDRVGASGMIQRRHMRALAKAVEQAYIDSPRYRSRFPDAVALAKRIHDVLNQQEGIILA